MTERPLAFLVSDETMARIVKTLTGDDTFSVLYILAKAGQLLPLESLSRDYGANPSELKDRLAFLQRLGLVRQKGRSYFSTAKATAAVSMLEAHYEHVHLPAVDAVGPSSESVFSASGEASTVATQYASTNDGTWSSIHLSVSATAEATITPERSNPISEQTPTSVVDQTTKTNATRSQLYL